MTIEKIKMIISNLKKIKLFRNKEEAFGILFAAFLVFGLIGWIYMLCMGADPLSFPAGEKKVTGFAGGHYVMLCM